VSLIKRLQKLIRPLKKKKMNRLSETDRETVFYKDCSASKATQSQKKGSSCIQLGWKLNCPTYCPRKNLRL